MSSKDKIEFLAKARAKGFRTYLYFVATEDPEINVARVASRVAQGGHDVPADKIRGRYKRCLDNLLNAIVHCDRAYIWDNSSGINEEYLVAEVDDGVIEIASNNPLPTWFEQAVWNQLTED